MSAQRRTELFKTAPNAKAPATMALLFLLNHFFAMSGIVWTQATAGFLNVIASYIIYCKVIGGITNDGPN